MYEKLKGQIKKVAETPVALGAAVAVAGGLIVLTVVLTKRPVYIIVTPLASLR